MATKVAHDPALAAAAAGMKNAATRKAQSLAAAELTKQVQKSVELTLGIGASRRPSIRCVPGPRTGCDRQGSRSSGSGECATTDKAAALAVVASARCLRPSGPRDGRGR